MGLLYIYLYIYIYVCVCVCVCVCMCICIGCIFGCLTDKRLPNSLSARRLTPRVGEFQHSVTVVRQMIAVITILRKCGKNLLERRAVAYRSSREKHSIYIYIYSDAIWDGNFVGEDEHCNTD